jgi:curved DNA-binding protein
VPASGLAGSDLRLRPKASVRWCRAQAGGIYRAGLQFEKTAAAPEPKAEAEDDYYEVLQVNPKATADTIHRVYRILAQQYHPDNRETGDEASFRTVTAAYKVLSDPETRAAYDLRYESARSQRWKIFTTPQSVQGVEGERRKRFGVLRALYAKRLQDPRQPEMSIQELEGLLGVARDHLEFTLWYLKERAFVSRSDNIRFLITAAGVEQTELLEEAHVAREQIDSSHLLPAAGRPAR